MSETTDSLFLRLSEDNPSPTHVQRLLRQIPYNTEDEGESVRSALMAWHAQKAHCLEAAFIAAAILERQGYPPLILSLESQDNIDHVLFIFKSTNGWGAIGKSREEGLHGRAPIYRSVLHLAWSYVDPYVDDTGRVTGYAIANLDDTRSRWRDSNHNVWKAEEYLIDLPHKKLRTSEYRYQRELARFFSIGQKPWQPSWW